MNNRRVSSALFLPLLCIASISPAQWPRFHGNSCNTGVYPGGQGRGGAIDELWNYPIKLNYTSSPALADLDDDGLPEIIIGSDADTMYAFNGEDGSILWTYTSGGGSFSLNSPVVADIDGDLKPDVVFSNSTSVTALHGDSGDLLWIMPVYATNGQTPCLADLDGDETLEVVFTGTNGTTAFDGETGAVLWEADGFFSSYLGSSVAEDTDLDGTAEVMACTTDPENAFCLLNGEDGSLIWSTPLTVTGSILTPAAAFGDIDLDGVPEIVCCSGDNDLTVMNALDGSVEWSAGISGYCYSSPCLVDLDGNDSLEIVVVVMAPKRVRVYSCTGDLLWTVIPSFYAVGSPAVVDIDGDQTVEIIQTSSSESNCSLQIFDGVTGDVEYSFTHNGCMYTSPAVGDVDGDGFYDIVFDIDYNYLCVMSTGFEGVDPGDGRYLTSLTINPNPLVSSSSISFVLSRPGHTSVEIFDLSGRMVASLENSELAAGEYQYRWDSDVPPGVYLCRITSGEVSETAAMCVLK